MSKPLNKLTDEHLSDVQKATLREWQTKILRHLAVTPDAPCGVMALQPIVVRSTEDMGNYYNAINWLHDRGWIDRHDLTTGIVFNEVAALQINEDGLAELRRRGYR